ncbi:MAG: hypothetical protein HOD72_02885 [Opitutae bacterium]|nr:hypothetical protein [Opitutae bacterium]MBT6463388.1 hypothetical protein [Opitutae bacterium]
MKLPKFLTPSSADEPPGILKLPGHLFFCEYVEVPATVEPSGLEDFAEMTVSGLSPFPPEQLAWGYYKNPSYPWMLVYLATFESLAKAGFRDLENYHQVLPSFISALGTVYETPTGFFHYGDGSLTLFLYPGFSPAPVHDSEDEDEQVSGNDAEAILLPMIFSLPVEVPKPHSDEEEESDVLPEPSRADIETVRARLYKMIPEDRRYDVQRAWLRDKGYSYSKKGGSLHLEHVWDEVDAPLPEPEHVLDGQTELWSSDIREPAFTKQAKKNRLMEEYLGLALLVAGIAAVVLVFFEFLTFTGDNWAASMAKRVTDNTPQVAEIMAKRELLSKIEQLSTNNLRPFIMLQVLNDYRVGGLYFQSIEAKEGNVINIKGFAINGGEVNTFKQALISSERVLGVETSMKTSGGKTTFELEASFPPVKPEEPEAETLPVSTSPIPSPVPEPASGPLAIPVAQPLNRPPNGPPASPSSPPPVLPN